MVIHENDSFQSKSLKEIRGLDKMILNTMLGDNKKATDESRENAGCMNDYTKNAQRARLYLTWEGVTHNILLI